MLESFITGNLKSLTELISCGASGSFFYYSHNGQYLLKTIKKNEFNTFRQILKHYYEYIMNNYNTLIC